MTHRASRPRAPGTDAFGFVLAIAGLACGGDRESGRLGSGSTAGTSAGPSSSSTGSSGSSTGTSASESGSGTSGSGSSSGTSSSGSTATSGSESSTSTSDSGSSTGASESSGSGAEGAAEDGGFRFDLAGDGDGGSGQGCGKIDFVFMIDSSGSMSDEQTNLINSFPGFIDAILSTTAKNFHILVTDTDAQDNWAMCRFLCGGGWADCAPGVPCSSVPPPAGDACEITLGGGHVRDQYNAECGVKGPQHYLLADQPNLTDTFACIARVGNLGDGGERQAGAATGAVSPAMVGPGGCNEGFLRDDAILVLTIISDEDDDLSPGTPESWKQALVDAKHGDENAIVVLGLTGDASGSACGPLAGTSGATPAPSLHALVTSFTHGSWGGVCEPDYAPFFAEAISVIDLACDEFVPPG